MTQMTGPADLRDQRWLAERVEALGNGIEAARDIWANWFDGRQVARFHPGLTPGQYIASLGMRLTLPEALAAMPDASTRQVAAVAGVHHSTVAEARVGNPTPEPIRGADGKTYPARTVTAVVIDTPEEGVLDETPNTDSLDHYYVDALRKYIAGIVNVTSPAVGQPPLMRRRHALERALQAVLDDFIR